MGKYRVYDWRLKKAIVDSGNPDLFPELQIPKSTAKGWIKNGISDVVTLPALDLSTSELVAENELLKNQLSKAEAKEKLALFAFKLFGLQIQYRRLPKEECKEMLLEAIQSATKLLSLAAALEVIGLSAARYYSWIKRRAACELEDQKSCPRSTPMKLSSFEISRIKYFVTSLDYVHFSIASLSWYCKRIGEVYASPSSWGRVIRELDLRRPLKRVYPAKPKIGIRASGPNQVWHLDQTIIKLIDGSKCYIQAVVDNYSRFILAHSVSGTCSGQKTKNLIRSALQLAAKLGFQNTPNVLTESGSENVNSEVDELISENNISRTIAQTEIDFSNSMVEALFRRMKHGYLYLKTLSSEELLRKYTDFYVEQSNKVVPHSSLKGGTPLKSLQAAGIRIRLNY